MADSSDKTERVPLPSLAIDGSRIRSIRETKKLTQLYVASVVGVTTDTISRWENNRYPSIKRDNAQKLADALEVPLEEILRPEASDAPEPLPESPPPRPPRRWLFPLLLASGALALVTLLFFLLRPSPPAPAAVRWAPRFAAPGEIVPVQIKVDRRAASPFGFILRERLPSGTRLLSSLPAPSSAGSEAKWLVPSGGNPATVSYTLKIPAPLPSGSDAAFNGEVVIHGGSSNRIEPVGGNASIHIGAYHWADYNGDGRIDDDEIMTAYYICEEMKGLGLDWKTIEAIWSGKGYRWDARKGYQILK